MIVDSINAIIPGIIVLKSLDLHNKSAMNFCLCSVYLLNGLDPFEKAKGAIDDNTVTNRVILVKIIPLYLKAIV